MSDEKEPLGFIGLGILGAPMAGHLRRAGYPMFVYSRTKARARELLEDGAVWCDSPGEGRAGEGS